MRKIYIPTEFIKEVDYSTYGLSKPATMDVYLNTGTQAFKDWVEDVCGVDAFKERDYVMLIHDAYWRFSGYYDGARSIYTSGKVSHTPLKETLEEKVERLEKEIEDLNASRMYLHKQLKLKDLKSDKK